MTKPKFFDRNRFRMFQNVFLNKNFEIEIFSIEKMFFSGILLSFMIYSIFFSGFHHHVEQQKLHLHQRPKIAPVYVPGLLSVTRFTRYRSSSSLRGRYAAVILSELGLRNQEKIRFLSLFRPLKFRLLNSYMFDFQPGLQPWLSAQLFPSVRFSKFSS